MTDSDHQMTIYDHECCSICRAVVRWTWCLRMTSHYCCLIDRAADRWTCFLTAARLTSTAAASTTTCVATPSTAWSSTRKNACRSVCTLLTHMRYWFILHQIICTSRNERIVYVTLVGFTVSDKFGYETPVQNGTACKNPTVFITGVCRTAAVEHTYAIM